MKTCVLPTTIGATVAIFAIITELTDSISVVSISQLNIFCFIFLQKFNVYIVVIISEGGK